MRKYLRHPSSIPVELTVERTPCIGQQQLANIARGGFACWVYEPLPVGATVQLRIPMIWPEYCGCGVVRWCRAAEQAGEPDPMKFLVDNEYEVGIEFSAHDLFKAKMVEQLCQIEDYRNRLWIEDGRIVDGEQAALEWIARYAKDFADAFQDLP
jgi:hypothetical protein